MFPNKILRTGGSRYGRREERTGDMPNSMSIPFSVRNWVGILISCGKQTFESKNESLRMAGTFLSEYKFKILIMRTNKKLPRFPVVLSFSVLFFLLSAVYPVRPANLFFS